MRIKEESLDQYITAPVSGVIIYVREIDPEFYPFLYKSYPELFEVEVVEPVKTNEDDSNV